MIGNRPLCSCPVCADPGPEFHVAPPAALDAIRSRSSRTAGQRIYCPRCGEPLGYTETVIDSVGYAHFVQPCRSCAALWVL